MIMFSISAFYRATKLHCGSVYLETYVDDAEVLCEDTLSEGFLCSRGVGSSKSSHEIFEALNIIGILLLLRSFLRCRLGGGDNSWCWYQSSSQKWEEGKDWSHNQTHLGTNSEFFNNTYVFFKYF